MAITSARSVESYRVLGTWATRLPLLNDHVKGGEVEAWWHIEFSDIVA